MLCNLITVLLEGSHPCQHCYERKNLPTIYTSWSRASESCPCQSQRTKLENHGRPLPLVPSSCQLWTRPRDATNNSAPLSLSRVRVTDHNLYHNSHTRRAPGPKGLRHLTRHIGSSLSFLLSSRRLQEILCEPQLLIRSFGVRLQGSP